MTKASSQSVVRRWGVFVILGLFLVLAVYYNVSTPPYESPDELQHAAFVVWLVDGLHLVWVIGLGVLVYVGLVLGLRLLDETEWTMILRLVRKLRNRQPAGEFSG